jgi:hypothetical protein
MTNTFEKKSDIEQGTDEGEIKSWHERKIALCRASLADLRQQIQAGDDSRDLALASFSLLEFLENIKACQTKAALDIRLYTPEQRNQFMSEVLNLKKKTHQLSSSYLSALTAWQKSRKEAQQTLGSITEEEIDRLLDDVFSRQPGTDKGIAKKIVQS